MVRHMKRSLPAGAFWLVAVPMFLTLLPLRLDVAGLLLTPTRVFFLLVIPMLMIRLFSGAYGKILLMDWMVILYIVWYALSMVVNSPGQAVSLIGMQGSIVIGSYFCARAAIRTTEDFLKFSKIYLIIVLVTLPLALYESITAQFVIPELINMIPGLTSVPEINYERRLGLDRAQVVFSHPIHYGFFATAAVAYFFCAFKNTTDFFRRCLAVFGCLVGGVLAVSSGPMLGAVFQMALIGYDWVTRIVPVPARWKLLAWVALVIYTVGELASPYPFLQELANRVALNSGTASVRGVIFEYGSQQVLMTPILGVGNNEWQRPVWMLPSIDNEWLLTAVRSGIPALIFQLIAFFWPLFYLGRKRFNMGSDLANIRLAYLVAIFGWGIVLVTVSTFAEMTIVLHILLGSGAFLFTAEEESADEKKEPEAPRRRAVFGDLVWEKAAGVREPAEPVRREAEKLAKR